MGAATAEPEASARVIDEDEGVIEQTCPGLEIKSHGGNDFIEGYVATKGVDSSRDMFSEKALEQIAEDINQGGGIAKVLFPSPEMIQQAAAKAAEDDPTKNGNVDHYNSSRRGDPRVVSAFALTEAQFDGFGVKVKARLMNEAIPDETVDEIKNAVNQGLLDAFSVEWVTMSFTQREVEGKTVRVIEEAKFRGAALTGRPVNQRAKITEAELKSLAGEEKAQHVTIQTPSYQNVSSEAAWSGRPSEEDFPDDFDANEIFLARFGDNFSENSLPVVKMVNGEPTLVLDGLRSAHTMASRVDGLSDDEVERVRSKAESLAQEEFDTDISNEEKSENNITGDTMPDDEPQDNGESDGEETDAQDQTEEKSDVEEFKSELEDVRDTVEEVKSEREELQERVEELEDENEELKSDLEDYQELEELKSDISEVRDELKSLEPEDETVSDDEQDRMEEQKSQEENKAEKLVETFQDEHGRLEESKARAIADKTGKTVEEVKNLA